MLSVAGRRCYPRMTEGLARGDLEASHLADLAFHRGVLLASHNIVFRQLAMAVAVALGYVFRINLAGTRDPEGAQMAMARLLNLAIIDLGLSTVSNAPRTRPPLP